MSVEHQNVPCGPLLIAFEVAVLKTEKAFLVMARICDSVVARVVVYCC